MAVNTTPRFSMLDAVRFSNQHYALSADASPLPSERDQNFALVSAKRDRFILKIAKSDEKREVLELQNAVLARAATGAPDLALPRLVPTVAGDEIAEVAAVSRQTYFLRLLTWVDGELLVHTQPHTDNVLGSLGAALADLNHALRRFSHPAMHRELEWDVKHADLALRHLSVLPADQQRIVCRFMRQWDAINWHDLRSGLIHGDANDYNVVLRSGQVVGFLDFGDTVHSAVACDLAIALAYAMLGKPDPIAAALPVIRAYHARFPLTIAEIDALYSIVTARLCMSVCYAANNARVKSTDAYQQVTAGPAAELLRHLATIPVDDVRAAFNLATGTA